MGNRRRSYSIHCLRKITTMHAPISSRAAKRHSHQRMGSNPGRPGNLLSGLQSFVKPSGRLVIAQVDPVGKVGKDQFIPPVFRRGEIGGRRDGRDHVPGDTQGPASWTPAQPMAKTVSSSVRVNACDGQHTRQMRLGRRTSERKGIRKPEGRWANSMKS